MGAVVVCGRAKSAPGGAAAPRVRRGPLPRESSDAGPGCSPQAPRRASSSTGSPTRPTPSPGTAHDPGMSSLCRRLAALLAPVLLVGLVAAAPRPGPPLTRCPSASGRSGRRPRWSPGSTRRTHPGAPATAASTCSVPRDKRCTRRWPARCPSPGFSRVAGWSSSSTATPGPPTSPSRPPSRSARAVGRGEVIGHLQAVASHCPPRVCLHWGWLRGPTYLDPLDLVGAGPSGCCRSGATCRSR